MKPILVLRHVPHEGLGLISELLREAGLTYSYLDLFNDPPRHIDVTRLSALVVMGGPMNVDETSKYPFLAHEVEWIRTAVHSGVPVLGVCLGSQLLAKALGARVYPAEQKEIGWYEIELLDAAADDPLLSACRRRETVFQWHGDTFDLPRDSVWLAKSEGVAHQAFRHGKNAWGLQFHVEMTPQVFDLWLREPGLCADLNSAAYIDRSAIERRAPAEFPPLMTLGRHLLGGFVAQCR